MDDPEISVINGKVFFVLFCGKHDIFVLVVNLAEVENEIADIVRDPRRLPSKYRVDPDSHAGPSLVGSGFRNTRHAAQMVRGPEKSRRFLLKSFRELRYRSLFQIWPKSMFFRFPKSVDGS
jgi:hypothetical protein